MKAISLTQPWASAVALGIKHVETRSWSTKYRGPIAIHAAKGFPKEAHGFAIQEWGRGVLPIAPSDLPRGAVVAIAQIARVERTGALVAVGAVDPVERRYGDYSFGRFAWFLEDVKPLTEPIPARGALGLWEWDDVPHRGLLP